MTEYDDADEAEAALEKALDKAFDEAVASWEAALDGPTDVGMELFREIRLAVSAKGKLGEGQTRLWILSFRAAVASRVVDPLFVASTIWLLGEWAFQARDSGDYEKLWDQWRRWHILDAMFTDSIPDRGEDSAAKHAERVMAEIDARHMNGICAILKDAGEGELARWIRANPGGFAAHDRRPEERPTEEALAAAARWRNGWNVPGAAPNRVKHVAFRDYLTALDDRLHDELGEDAEESREVAAPLAGVLALQMLDTVIDGDHEIVAPESPKLRSARSMVTEIPASDPLRGALLAFLNQVQRAPVDGVEAAVARLIPVAEAYRARGDLTLAGDVYWTAKAEATDEAVRATAAKGLEEVEGEIGAE